MQKVTVRGTIDSCEGDKLPRLAGPGIEGCEDDDGDVEREQQVIIESDCSIDTFTRFQGRKDSNGRAKQDVRDGPEETNECVGCCLNE